MAALGEVGTYTRRWLSWCDVSYNRCYDYLPHKSFSRYIHSIITDDMVEIPALMFKKEYMDKSLPVCGQFSDCIIRRSADMAFKDGEGAVVEVKIKDTLFLIGRGVIMDALYNPLIVYRFLLQYLHILTYFS